MRTIFKNKENMILIFSKNYSYYLNLLLFMFFQIGKKESNVFLRFSCSPYFLEQKIIFKNYKKIDLNSFSSLFLYLDKSINK